MYKGLEARLHDVFWDVEAGGVELELIKSHLGETQEHCLEIGCGSGRILLPLLEEGYKIDGNDVSEDMVELLKENLAIQNSTNDTVEKLPPPAIFHGKTIDQDVSKYKNIIIPAFTLMLMSEDEASETLTYLNKSTEEGTSLYITVFMPWAEICGELEEKVWYKDHEAKNKDGSLARCKTQFEIDRTFQILKRKHKYMLKQSNGMKEEEQSEQQLRWYCYNEFLMLLKINGWEHQRTIFDLDAEADSENAHIYTFIATSTKS